MVTNFAMPMANDNPAKLRIYCEEFSREMPDAIILGQMLFGKFANIEVLRFVGPDHPLTRSQLQLTSLGGYWRAGKFQLFSASELALAEKDDDNE